MAATTRNQRIGDDALRTPDHVEVMQAAGAAALAQSGQHARVIIQPDAFHQYCTLCSSLDAGTHQDVQIVRLGTPSSSTSFPLCRPHRVMLRDALTASLDAQTNSPE